MRCVERYAQAEHAVAALSSADNVVFGGDMCWNDGTDRPFPLPAGWFDAWQVLKNPYGGTDSCWTYDSMWEEEVAVFNGFAAPYESTMRKRSDRFVCKLKDYSLNGMEIIGDPNTNYVLLCANLKRDYRFSTGLRRLDHVRLGPSCHRGLLMTIVPTEPALPDVPGARGGANKAMKFC